MRLEKASFYMGLTNVLVAGAVAGGHAAGGLSCGRGVWCEPFTGCPFIIELRSNNMSGNKRVNETLCMCPPSFAMPHDACLCVQTQTHAMQPCLGCACRRHRHVAPVRLLHHVCSKRRLAAPVRGGRAGHDLDDYLGPYLAPGMP